VYLDYQGRFYLRDLKNDLEPTLVNIEDSKILILSKKRFSGAQGIVSQLREDIIRHIEKERIFENSLIALESTSDEPYIIRIMKRYSQIMKVGPMACVAGAIAQILGERLFNGEDMIVENGGDIFICKKGPIGIRVYTDDEIFKDRLLVNIDHCNDSVGIATSSATIGPSLSFGRTSATIVISNNCALSDAAATRIANEVRSSNDLERTLKKYKRIIYDFNIPITGVLCIIDSNMAAFGKIKVSLE
jgi:ApbE superfamily uncharacterized protein (UPF0280 family)